MPEMMISMSLRHFTIGLFCSFLLGATACHSQPPSNDPTAVARGLRFVSHNAAFDAFFADLHEEQLAMLQLPEQERKLRKDLATDLKVADGATTMVLAERAAAIAQGLSAQGTTLKLDVEGYNAVDEADTAAQMRVNGSLEGENLKFAEAIARTARSELKVLAQLNAKEQTLQRLAARATILESEADRAFAAADSKQLEAVHRNLSDARLLIALMDERRLDLAVDVRRTVERLASEVTTNPTLGASNEPPLVTFVKTEPPKERSPNRARTGGGPATPVRGGATKSAPEANAPPDFEP
jgi:hypothetical protein